MKLKQLSTEFEYFTPKWHIFGLIQFRTIAYILFNIWTTTVQNFIPIYEQIWIIQIFSHFLRFFHRILTILPQNSNFWTYSAWHHSLYSYLDHEPPICKISCFYQKVYHWCSFPLAITVFHVLEAGPPPFLVCRTLFPPVFQDPIYTDCVLYRYTSLI